MITMRTFPKMKQTGSMLIEAMVGILIFSMGILAIVGLQAASIKMSSDAKYRSDASLLANQLIGQMWTSDRTLLQTDFVGPNGAAYVAWLGASQTPATGTVRATLPGVTETANLPAVTVDANNVVTITLNWRLPSETPGTPAHKYTATTQIR